MSACRGISFFSIAVAVVLLFLSRFYLSLLLFFVISYLVPLFFQPALKTPIPSWNTRVGAQCMEQDNDAYREDGTMVMRISRLPPQFSPRSQPNPAYSNVEQCRLRRLCRQKGRKRRTTAAKEDQYGPVFTAFTTHNSPKPGVDTNKRVALVWFGIRVG